MNLKKLRNKVIAAFAVMMFALVTTVGVTYAYWNMLQVEKDEVLVVGEGVALELAVVAAAPVGKTLVPTGQVVDTETQVDSITLTYNVKLDRTLSAALDLTVEVSNKLIGGSATYAGLVNISITNASTVNGTNVLVTVVITLTEPASQEAYDAIINKNITFTLIFTAAA